MTQIIRLCLILALGLLTTACTTTHYDQVRFNETQHITQLITEDPEQDIKIEALTQAILDLAPAVANEEASFIARESVLYSMVLANRYDLKGTPLWQNVLVNSGYREAGLCWQWARDLHAHLFRTPLKTLYLHHAVAYKGTFREHNALVVTEKGKAVANGIVLDPWRNSGRLHWEAVSEDKYPWLKF